MQYLPTKAELDRNIQDVASEIASRMTRWKFFSERLNTITNQQLFDLGYTQVEVDYIRSFQTALSNIEPTYRDWETDRKSVV